MPSPNSNTLSIEVQLTRGYVAIIDACDADLASLRWGSIVQNNSNTVYAQRYTNRVNGVRSVEMMHRVVLQRILGRELVAQEQVDHKNNNGLDNRRENLRLATQNNNQQNKGLQANNSSGYKGVCWHRGNQKWIASIGVNKRKKFLGYFDSPEAAYDAYCKAARELHGEFARLE